MTKQAFTLKRWHPLLLNAHKRSGPPTATFKGEPPGNTMLVDLDPTMASHRNLVTLHRACRINGLLDNLFEANSALEGQPWYDRLARIVAMDTVAVIDGEKTPFTWTSNESWKNPRLQTLLADLNGNAAGVVADWTTFEISDSTIAESIVVRVLVRTKHEDQSRRLRTDFGIGDEFATSPDEAGILATPDCRLGIDELKNLIADAIFKRSFDDRNDSYDTQWANFMETAHTVAASLLLNKDDGAAEAIRHAARVHLGHLLPNGRTVQLRKKPAPDRQIPDIEVVLLNEQNTP